MTEAAQKIIDRISKLRKEGRNAKEIAALFNEENLRTPRGHRFSTASIYNYISDGRSKVFKKKILPRMETLTSSSFEEPPKKGKVIAFVMEAEDIGDFLKGWARHG